MRKVGQRLFLEREEISALLSGLELIRKELHYRLGEPDVEPTDEAIEWYNVHLDVGVSLDRYDDSKGLPLDCSRMRILAKSAQRANAVELHLRLVREVEHMEDGVWDK